MGKKIRFSALEVDGVELEYATEYDLVAENVELNPPVSGFDDVDAWIRAQIGGDSCVGGAAAVHVFLASEEVGGCDATGA